ncbi:alpha-N-arabinofuranosidase [Altererythrobacter salegens]|uniref:non-reducing end alpha-L-arabinofuranosidase n=2 Tax=Croceibacterium salegens TaxID=1737568 RepID=A0A6I4SRF7_9SPHN|nr:alpha-N-arabinofuranosidase [Croceibacterium salegens]
MFIEPIGNLVGRTLWAEMLDDRKFYADVLPASVDPDPPARPGAPLGISFRKWRPLGTDGAVTMDEQSSVGGDQSVRIAVGTAPAGIVQGGIGIAKGRRYTGSLWFRGDPGAMVCVALTWGDGPDQRLTISLPAPQPGWQKVPFDFTPPADSDQARFEITGTGSGFFLVDAPTLMPADNIDGWRADTTAIARSLHSGMWRLPGGNFLSNWDWHEALGDRDHRRPMYDHAWSAIHSNDIGMDEWIELAQLVGADPYVTVNAGLGDANSAAELVEYLNGTTDSYWGSKRAANGHSEPYAIKYWNIGNEPYGDWQIGATTREYFMLKHREFADRMKRADPSIVLIGSGAMPDQRDPPGVPKVNPTIEDIKARFGNEMDWTYGLFDQAKGTFSGVTEHWYDRSEQRPDAPPSVELQEWTRSPQMQVRAKAMQWDLYRERFPWIDTDGIFLWIDEYAYIGGPANLKSALAYCMTLQEMLRHTGFLTGAAFTTGASTMEIAPNSSALNSTGLVFKFYQQHFPGGSVPVLVTGNAPVPAPQFPQGAEHPLTVGGSPTYPLDIIAAISADGTTIKLGVVNATFEKQELDLELKNIPVAGTGRMWVLTGPSLEAQNRIGKAPQVVSSTAKTVRGRQIAVPPLSISMLEFPLAK